MVIVDSSVWIDYFQGKLNNQTSWLDKAAGQQPIGMTSLILCEVLQGVRDDETFEAFQQDLMRFEIFGAGDADIAIAAARNYLTLRRRGFTIRKTIDCLIATFCMEEGHTLLHNDRDFDVFEAHLGLRVLHPPTARLH